MEWEATEGRHGARGNLFDAAGSLLAGIGSEASLASGRACSFSPANRYARGRQFRGGDLRIEGTLFAREAAPARNFIRFPRTNSERKPNGRN
jgi:hypothetical protein